MTVTRVLACATLLWMSRFFSRAWAGGENRLERPGERKKMGFPLLPPTHHDFQQHFLTWQLLTVQGPTHSDGARRGVDSKGDAGI